jgi:hypothetical protein
MHLYLYLQKFDPYAKYISKIQQQFTWFPYHINKKENVYWTLCFFGHEMNQFFTDYKAYMMLVQDRIN